MKKTIWLCLGLMMSVYMQAQDLLYSASDEIEINYSDAYGVHFLHKVAPGHTLYGLSRIFHVPVARIKLFNKMQTNQNIAPGQILRIPFDDRLMYKGVNLSDFPNGTFLPVYYTIKPKETLYRVSKVYFEQDADLILKRNKTNNNQLNIGQKLLMGWIPLDASITVENDKAQELAQQPTVTKAQPGVTYTVQDPVLSNPPVQQHSPEVHYQKHEEVGLAHWNRSGTDRDNLFVLHPTARINSLIELYNPQLKRRTFAKVIARIPDGVYAENIDVIVSPRVAQTLGALNTEFRVRMKFFE